MPEGPVNPREFGFYVSLAHVGLEMVAPMGLGIVLDRALGWTPWATVIGFALGFIGGFLHLLVILKRHEEAERRKPPGDAP